MMATKLLKRRIGVLPVIILGTLLMSGCIEQEIEQNLHEPGEYKGKTDPFLKMSGTQEFTDKLEQRLQQVQTDR